jgi:hypothetical protein
VVRSLLVPALSYDMGPVVWWPSKLWHTPDHADKETAEMMHLSRADGARGTGEDSSAAGSGEIGEAVDSGSEKPAG